MQVLPGRVGLVGFDKANARPRQLIDNDLEISCSYCKRFIINSHPILVMCSGESSGEAIQRDTGVSWLF